MVERECVLPFGTEINHNVWKKSNRSKFQKQAGSRKLTDNSGLLCEIFFLRKKNEAEEKKKEKDR